MQNSLTKNSRGMFSLLVLIIITHVMLKFGVNAGAFSFGEGRISAAIIWILSGSLLYFFILLVQREQKFEPGSANVFGTGLLYLFVVICASLFLNEYVSIGHWLGVGLISVGVILLSDEN